MKVIAVIPVHGRLPLLPYTIGRLYHKNNVDHVICVGDENERKTCEESGAQYIVSPNTLGLKWNNGFEEAGRQKADAIVFVGSSDWLSDDWLSATKYLDEYDMIGKVDFNMVHVCSQTLLLSNWPGYPKGNARHGEAIGIGRMIRAEMLDKFKWRPFRDDANMSMDWQMLQSVLKNKGKIYTIKDDIQSLSISTEIWNNKHKFFTPEARPIENGKQWLIDKFPEIFNFYENINNRQGREA